jgi:DMSO/TMAO reductase YedYZ molybdopterin-dependent catalytic subunit
LTLASDLAAGLDRRAFVRVAGVVGAVGVAGGAAWKFGAQGSYATTNLLTLPKAASPAPVVKNADFGIPGLTPYFTPNDDFYRIDTALVVPRLDHESWSLRISGMVDRPITLTYGDLLKAPLIERDVTLMCVSNEVGGDLTGNARWLGVRISDVLASVGVKPGADAVKTTSHDGWTCGTPLSALTDPNRDAMFAIGMNGQPLPYDHGFPVRMVVPGLYGFVSATKWITELEVTRFDEFEAYWTSRGWSAQAAVKTQSRIDVPEPYLELGPGPVQLAGVAWAQHRGIRKVEVLIDDTVHIAELAPWDNKDTWRQWRLPNWKPAPGNRIVAVRATDGLGQVQTAKHSRPDPDGATGWHTVAYPVS